MIKLIFLSLIILFISSCSSRAVIKNDYKKLLNEYEYAKFSSFHEGLFNFTYALKEMNEKLKKKYMEEYISGYKVYMELAQELAQISVDKSLNDRASYNKTDSFTKRILTLNANTNHKIQMNQIRILDDEISLESFKYGIRMSRYSGFWEIFQYYFFDYCVNFKKIDEKNCKKTFTSFVEEYKSLQEQTETPSTSEI